MRLSLCVSVCPRAYLWNRWTDLHEFSVRIPCGRGSVLFWRRCDILCTYGFMDDVTFDRNGPYGDAWKAEPLTTTSGVDTLLLLRSTINRQFCDMVQCFCCCAVFRVQLTTVCSHGRTFPQVTKMKTILVVFLAAFLLIEIPAISGIIHLHQ